MINSLTLTNFKRHRNLTIAFDSGLTALRGSNESGKSTVTHAIAYALFGVKAIPNSLEDTVTHGSPVGTLKVELVITLDGVQYSIKRSKSGCECNYAGGVVTGQTEVSNFVAKIMKVDAGAAARLTISPQSEIRGALEAGPKATTELIEKLADFDQIDNLIELMQEKLTLGNAATATAQREAAQARLDKARAVPEPDLKALVAEIVNAQSYVDQVQSLVAFKQGAANAALERHSKVQAHTREWDALTQSKVRFTKQLDTAQLGLADLRANPVPAATHADAEIQCMQDKKANLQNLQKARRVYEEVLPLLGTGDLNRGKGGARAWEAAVKRSQDALELTQKARREGEVMLAKAELEKHLGSCSFCGQDFSAVPAVIEKNIEVQKRIDALAGEQAKRGIVEAELTQKINELQAIQKEGRPTLAAAARHADYLDIDENLYPPVLTWKGEVPDTLDTIPDYDAMISAVRAAVRARAAFDAKQVELEASAKIASRELDALKVKSTEIGAPENEAQTADALRAARVQADEANDALGQARARLQTAQTNLASAQREWRWALDEVSAASGALDAAAQGLKDLEFNNTLLKRVRSCRPLLSDRLWSIVLSAVSKYFSDVRGQRSRVTKDSSGFLVDDHPVTTLSGSTLDALGLAIRVALVRTFLPNSPFLVLDEPNAAMDDARTSNMLGFIAACGFSQVILITHEEVSETVADHIVTLGD